LCGRVSPEHHQPTFDWEDWRLVRVLPAFSGGVSRGHSFASRLASRVHGALVSGSGGPRERDRDRRGGQQFHRVRVGRGRRRLLQRTRLHPSVYNSVRYVRPGGDGRFRAVREEKEEVVRRGRLARLWAWCAGKCGWKWSPFKRTVGSQTVVDRAVQVSPPGSKRVTPTVKRAR
jgi:hypothetical protein